MHFHFADCSVRLVPKISDDTSRTDSILAFIAENSSLMVLDSASNTYGVGRVFDSGGIRHNSGVPGSSCAVSGLAVVRGISESINLDHSGFSAITVHRDIRISVSHADN